jgi:hypothetical protein
MSEYERITSRVGKGIAVKETSFNDRKSIFNAIERLAELEDKIEQGKLKELPCKVGDTVYVIASCNDVDMYRIYEENRCECPFEYDCDYEDCDANGTTLRIFDTKVTGIYSTVGYKGFFVEFEYLNVQYQLEDFGEKFFLTREEAKKRLKELQG